MRMYIGNQTIDTNIDIDKIRRYDPGEVEYVSEDEDDEDEFADEGEEDSLRSSSPFGQCREEE